MPETRAPRIERLENLHDRTPRQDRILAADRAYRDGVTEHNERVLAWRESA